MPNFSFSIHTKSKKSDARRGTITTPYGKIETPAFVTVGTKGTVKSLDAQDLTRSNIQMIFVNTYHLVLSPGVDVIQKGGGIHNLTKIQVPIISDSGGFQVFSLAKSDRKNEESPKLVKITHDGVLFRSHIDGKQHEFTPEYSIKAQSKIGADFIVTFDECVYYGATEKYTEKSMQRTHEWAQRSLRASRLKHQQKIFGVIQGGMYKKFRRASAEFIASLSFWGLAIGGVSVGETKKEMRDVVKWSMEVLHKDKRPIHLLGVGYVDDIFDMIKMGVDTFDCVVPTRQARLGRLYVQKFENGKMKFENYNMIDIYKTIFKRDLKPIDERCECYTCKNFSKAYLHHLFKQRELLAYRLATIHNLYFIEKLFERIRRNIELGNF
ncbi:MAG TPA: tRNA guanosine(34) transglycosylase Tgt [Chryseolinea sp.]|uniref:Queuine tRNA-ribosyltransferase n=1 Tax=Candidatus Roizmanbacteria bacterium RIFCSPHIGHO2_02_FULL_37_24 TaxID=1802037 RepID=A0A1F7GUW3_9BACT|nr:MAG: hypothetical protein A2862_00545 [Candidatus Roizmanbacteria bacterium RIFCSPHIGHO2_01_FULL_38_41]OGK22564.1 MAG: hypothetical protein A3C24_05375 [Candidatus Roizmanbacteria bacterium RIFCSPHIGHO2_02_FULL_37_24]OGK32713.1 MAG: hypothetical protein A3E10_00310 [Candidatus Roizmanbacteria bacterium RIFCSPHIGHO2_12_FULL_37_23]OGK45274.1 MAG: hypothetical protein A2956_01955 [Candidatus Roizmanbacteria bacterium RIFCSPLOWO2_01_FULL_37_57]OGK54227.1 MAG: hypothetical protein A3H80_01255 [Ca